MEGEKAKLIFTDPLAETWEGSTKVDIGLSIVTTFQGEKGEETPDHYAAQVTRHGIADQFGIRWALLQILMKWSLPLQNLARVATAQLSWHKQNIVAIWLIGMEVQDRYYMAYFAIGYLSIVVKLQL